MFRLSFLLMLATIHATAQKEGQIALINQGKSPYRIIIPSVATSSEIRAAEILSKSIYKISGTMLPVLTDQHKERRYEISIGNTNRLKALSNNILYTKDIDPDGYQILSVKNKIFIVGGSHKGTILWCNCSA